MKYKLVKIIKTLKELKQNATNKRKTYQNKINIQISEIEKVKVKVKVPHSSSAVVPIAWVDNWQTHPIAKSSKVRKIARILVKNSLFALSLIL